MTLDVVAFWVFAVILVGAGLAVVLGKNLFHAVLWLALALVSTAGIFLTLNAEFIAAVQVLLYAGGVITVVVFAIAIYAFFLRIGLAGTTLGFVIAHTILALPFAIIPITAALEGFDKSIEDAAIVCGASPLQARLRITLPSIRIGIFSAAIFSFLASWDEVVVAIFMASPTLQTLPVKIWGSLRADLSPVVAAASSLLVGLTLCLMIVTALLRRKLSR